jgi:hypothetical protein
VGHSVVGFDLGFDVAKGALEVPARYYVYAVHNKLSEELYTVHKTP